MPQGKAVITIEAFKVAFSSLWAYKLRTLLTVLGVVIAVMTMSGVVAVIEGVNVYVAERVAAKLGAQVYVVRRFPIITNFEEFLKATRRNRDITLPDYEFLRDHLKLSRAVGASAVTTMDVKYKSQTVYDITVEGVTDNMIDLVAQEVEDGRYINGFEMSRSRRVCFIGADIVDNLFTHVHPLGKSLRINGVTFYVIGVATRIGRTFGQTQDNFVKIPLTTFHKMFGSRRSIEIWARALDHLGLEVAIDEARLLMRTRRHLKYHDEDNFGIITATTINELWKDLTGSIALAVVAVTSVFLVVGGIVIMNIMLAVVTERTREIGIRKALGARRRDILLQFLIESVLVAASGGALGILLAYVGTRLMAAMTPIPSSLPLWAVGLALVVSSGVGLFFGLYPAGKAARLDPIAALRAE